jgi:activator of HSP90 ATPase
MNKRNIFNFSRKIISNNILVVCSLWSLFSFVTGNSARAQGQTGMYKTGNGRDSANSIVIHQEADFNVPPHRVYQTLLSSKEFSDCIKKSFPDFTANSATIEASPGGTFTLFDGHIIGRILELVPDQLIVEAWRVVDWPAGDYSIAKFEFKPKGTGTHLIFEHIGFPEGLKQHLSEGWQQHYWNALAKYFQ